MLENKTYPSFITVLKYPWSGLDGLHGLQASLAIISTRVFFTIRLVSRPYGKSDEPHSITDRKVPSKKRSPLIRGASVLPTFIGSRFMA